VAGTVCDLKFSLGSFSRNLGEAEVPNVPASESYSSTPHDLKTQVAATLPSEEALRESLLRLVDSAHALHASARGSTVSLADGDLLGRKLFVVSIYPERSVELVTSPSWQNIFAFASLNLDLLVKPGHAFGSWLDLSHALDVVVCLSDLRTALELGRIFNQTAIYDLAAAQEIVIGADTFVPSVVSAHPEKRLTALGRSL
jgi:hypothetical protein